MAERATGGDGHRRFRVRLLWLVLIGLLLGAAALWLSSRMRWSAEPVAHGLAGTVEQPETGAEAVPALVPLAVLVLAGIAGMLATRGWGRRVLCGVVGLAGTGGAALAVTGALDGPQPAHGVALLGGLLVLCAATVGAVAAATMPAMGVRYTRGAQAEHGQRATGYGDTELWDALSAGDDPTTDR
ncbi:Trp biosynthesis-associated membrane protein [Haloechinothrix sp. LS1_15]|uniref:Trp biosynthesis-associated membrane protein n=1 Tax=Haloechinothrix sp. LS1_15 TaxID=2652248 RepID=UPI0029459D23|nr:Trp biosynthesis-associated membrane protein [Haloechinothrix sp. LS1_15]MDV6012680.1 Trp biosynthesis-associated membrane protein [Haloechinothrix sp. LS1_15]